MTPLPQKSAYVLGRRPVRERFDRDGFVLVGVIACMSRSSRPWIMYLENSPDKAPSAKCLYRIRVRRK